MSTVILLKDYPLPKIDMACDRCDRTARYDKAALMERVGGDIDLPGLRLEIAAKWGREIARKQVAGEYLPDLLRCGAIFPDLAKLYRGPSPQP